MPSAPSDAGHVVHIVPGRAVPDQARSRDLRIPLTLDSTIAEVLADPAGRALLGEVIGSLMPADGADSVEAMGVDILALIGSAPVGRMVSFSGGAVTLERLEQLLAAANAAADRA